MPLAPATARFSEPAAAQPESDEEHPETERLVLTEALRIRPPEADTGNADTDEITADEIGDQTAERRLHLDSAPEMPPGAEENLEAGDRDEGIAGGAAGAEEDTEAAGQAQPVSNAESTEDEDNSRAESDDIFATTTEEAEQMTQAQAWKAPEREASEPEDILLAEAAEERILDEETLREIVAQTVREELMGELGERITRNVKKLVRREIQRALAERAFD